LYPDPKAKFTAEIAEIAELNKNLKIMEFRRLLPPSKNWLWPLAMELLEIFIKLEFPLRSLRALR
jgi:hypothetical protein